MWLFVFRSLEASVMPYSAEISRANPTCFVFLIDQSKSMRGLIGGGGGKTKAEAAADSINHLLYSLTLRCVWGQSVLDRFHVGVLGYGGDVRSALPGGTGEELISISALARSPLRVETRPNTSNPSGAPVRFPIWFDPVADGKTPMCAALHMASNVLSTFLIQHPNCFPPIVINLSDGEANDGDPEGPALQMRQLSSIDGSLLLFNLHVSSNVGEAVMFPNSETGLLDDHARRLFRMSSTLPSVLWEPARQAGYVVNDSTRGFAFNADLSALIRFLNIGTQVGAKNRS
jgi:hypothetical protein